MIKLLPTDKHKRRRQKLAYAKSLKKRGTAAEKKLRPYMFLIGYKYQEYDPTGFLPDFYAPWARVALEVDGSVHKRREQKQRDKYKDKVRRRNKIYTVRVSNWRGEKLPSSVLVECILTGIVYKLYSLVRYSL